MEKKHIRSSPSTTWAAQKCLMLNPTFQTTTTFLPTFANKHRFWHAPAVQLVPSRCDFPPELPCMRSWGACKTFLFCQWHFISIRENMRNDSISKQNMALRSVNIDMAAVNQWVDPACWQTSAWAGEHVLLTGVQGRCHCGDFDWHLDHHGSRKNHVSPRGKLLGCHFHPNAIPGFNTMNWMHERYYTSKCKRNNSWQKLLTHFPPLQQ